MLKKVSALALALVMCLSLMSVSASAADGDFVIEDGVLTEYNGSDANVTIPGSVTAIGDYAFYGCESLTSVTIPASVKSIGESAFAYCGNLTSAPIPYSVQSIGTFAFEGCAGLTSVTVPNGVKTISDNAFADCTGLTSVTIKYGVKAINNDAFHGCTGLTEMTIPGSVESIGSSAFYGCTGLTKVTIENGMKIIGMSAFLNCDKLADVIIPPSVTEVATAAVGMKFDGESGTYLPYDQGHVTVHGQAGSAAETYAKDNSITFAADWSGQSIDPVAKFKDVNAGDWFVDAVSFAVNHSLFQGVADDEFAPYSPMNRAMFVVVLARIDKVSDTSGDPWYEHDVQWARENGYLGDEDVMEAIPRQEMAEILYRHAGSPKVSGDLSSFTDASTVAPEAKDAMLWATQNGYIKGMGDNSLAPAGTANRAQVATIFMNVFG